MDAYWSLELKMQEMAQETKFRKIDRNELPVFYRVILNVPVPAFFKSINVPSGIFWAMILPLAIFFSVFLNIYLLLLLSFPINIIMVCILPALTFLVLVRVTANRFIDWWNSAVVGGYVQQEIKKVLDEYIALREKKQ
jgi:hypothetical protein